VIYSVFYFWYGGSGDPISPEEAEKYIAIAEERASRRGSREGGASDFPAKLRQIIATDDGQEFVMVNLNVYRDAPEYADDVDGSEAIATAAEAEAEYQRRIAPLMLSRALHPLVMVEPAVHLSGTGEFERQDWSRITMVRYRSRRDMLEFLLSPEFAEDVDHKWAALSRSHAMITVPHLSFATVRLVPLLIRIVIGLLLDRIGARAR